MPPEEEAPVDQSILEVLELNTPDVERGVSKRPSLSEVMTVFKHNIPSPPPMGTGLGRSSYTDDIVHGTPTRDQLGKDLNEH